MDKAIKHSTDRRSFIKGASIATVAASIPIVTLPAIAMEHDPLPALVENFLPIHAEHQRISNEVAEQREYWSQQGKTWEEMMAQSDHADLERRYNEVSIALDAAEKPLWSLSYRYGVVSPTTLAGAVAVLRYALAWAWQDDYDPDEQPSDVRAILAVIAFLAPMAGKGGAARARRRSRLPSSAGTKFGRAGIRPMKRPTPPPSCATLSRKRSSERERPGCPTRLPRSK